jgi:flagellar capping protein FliD
MNATALQPFLTTALPIMFAILVAAWMNSKAFDGMNTSINAVHKRLDDMREDLRQRFDQVNQRFNAMDKRFDKIDARLERIEAKLDNHETRLVRLEERTSPLTGVR